MSTKSIWWGWQYSTIKKNMLSNTKPYWTMQFILLWLPIYNFKETKTPPHWTVYLWSIGIPTRCCMENKHSTPLNKSNIYQCNYEKKGSLWKVQLNHAIVFYCSSEKKGTKHPTIVSHAIVSYCRCNESNIQSGSVWAKFLSNKNT